MLATLRSVWPPVVPDMNTGTGTKTKRTDYIGITITESLMDLHDGAWWTGVSILIPETTPREFLVTMFDDDGILSTLRLMSGEQQPFQWALPACVAHKRGIGLHITPVLPDPIPFVQIVSFFHEIGRINPQTALHFMCDDYRVAFSYVPDSVVNHAIIPTMKKLYETDVA